jgi:hypothetical protein
VEQLLLGLIDVLVSRGVVGEDDVEPAARAVADEIAKRNELPPHTVTLREDSPNRPAGPRNLSTAPRACPLPRRLLQADGQLSAEEVEGGQLRWDLGRLTSSGGKRRPVHPPGSRDRFLRRI